MVTLSRITTKGGDSGQTSLGNGDRVTKESPLIVCLGSIDELNSYIGLAYSFYTKEDFCCGLLGVVETLQNDLFDMGADICVPYSEHGENIRITEEHIIRLENLIEENNKKLEPVNSFILPGGSIVSSFLHVARTTCRRAERSVVSAKNKGQRINPQIIIYLNRLSDLLFIFARSNNDYGKHDVLWEPGESVKKNKHND